MSERVTIAELLSQVFAQLNKSLSLGRNEALFQGWRNVLGGPGVDDLAVFENLGLVASSMTRLRKQITESKKLNDLIRRSQLQTVGEFAPLFEFPNLTQPGANFMVRCADKARGDLATIGLALESEYSEPKLQAADAEDIAKSLREVQKLLADSSLPLDLRVNLEKLLKTMLWWLGKPEIVSVQDLFESVGSAMIISGQLVEKSEKSSEDTQEAARSIKTLVGGAAKKLARLVGYSVENADKIEKLVHAAEGVSKLTQ